jgi:hypothetical protein
MIVDSAEADRPARDRSAPRLEAGGEATFIVVRGRVSETHIRGMLIASPPDVLAVVVAGQIEVWDGHAVRPAGTGIDEAAWIGAWDEPRANMIQYLRPDGRYSETRSGRVDAWTGQYWTHRDRITYLDDTGFWAFGHLVGDTLHHAGFVMNRL